jgi:hypothetical protein
MAPAHVAIGRGFAGCAASEPEGEPGSTPSRLTPLQDYAVPPTNSDTLLISYVLLPAAHSAARLPPGTGHSITCTLLNPKVHPCSEPPSSCRASLLSRCRGRPTFRRSLRRRPSPWRRKRNRRSSVARGANPGSQRATKSSPNKTTERRACKRRTAVPLGPRHSARRFGSSNPVFISAFSLSCIF